MAFGEQAARGVGQFEGFLDALGGLPWEDRLDNGDTLLPEPIGVAGLIKPWNWPINPITPLQD